MGDNTNQERESHSGHGGAGMDALMSAIEFRRLLSAQDLSRYSMMQDNTTSSGTSSAQDDVEKERLRTQHQVAAALYQNLNPSTLGAAGGGSNPLWANPVLMPLVPSVFPGLQPQGNLLRPGLSSADASESSDKANVAELSSLSFGFPGLPYFPSSGFLGLPADKITMANEAVAKSLRYPNLGNLGHYFNASGYQSLLSATAPGLLPSMAPGMMNPAALGTLGSYPSYYQNALLQRLPYMPHDAQMLRMPMSGGGLNMPSTQSRTPESSLMPDSPMRPQSGGYPLKESLQKRLSAPNPETGSQFRMPLRNETTVRLNSGGKTSSSYTSYPHRRNFPQPIAPAPECNRSPRPRAHYDPKSIERRISDIISENEKILCSPALEKVKPRRVFRRNSLDPPMLHPPSHIHPPLTATHSAPRSLSTKHNNPLMKEKTPTSERPNFLTVPSRLAEPSLPPQSCSSQRSSYTTVIPDPRRNPGTGRHISVMNEQQLPGPLTKPSQPLMQSEFRTPFQCDFCSAQFSRHDTYKTHKALYCIKRPLSAAEGSSARQSVIQHTALQPDGAASESSARVQVPKLTVSSPESQPDKIFNNSMSNAVPSQLPELIESPISYVHKDLQRTRSADATLLPHRFEGPVTIDCTVSDTASASNTSFSPTKCRLNESPKPSSLPTSMSSIPTNKLPPKKKQLQLMRSSGGSGLSSPRSSVHGPSPLTSDHSFLTQETIAVEESASNSVTLPSPRFEPPSSLALDAAPVPSWVPFDMGQKMPTSNSIILPTVYMTQPSPTHVGKSFSATSLLPSPTKERSSSPKSPSRRLSPGRSSRSPSRSPTSSSLESTIPRSNYKLLLHQLSLRNQQDMGYLSEAYRHSKDKKLKRNIASLLWSSMGTHSIDASGTSAKRACPNDGPSMEELYPGKASLVRRLSPNTADSRFSRMHNDSTLATKVPLTQSRSRPYESALRDHPTVTRSHSAGHSSDVSNNIKQYLENKNRNQQASRDSSTSELTKRHKPLTRTNANARYLLKSPTTVRSSSPVAETDLAVKSALEARNSMSEIGSVEVTQRLKESLAIKRASSHNPESSEMDYQSKRQKLVPIPKQSSTQALLPKSLVTTRLTDHILKKGEVKELPKIKSINPHTVQTPFLLQPHGSPSFGFEPHPTFCSLVSPQPMYIELQQSTLSMYSQWAVSEPLLPKGMTVLDIFNSTRFLKPLSPFISYGSLFTTPKEQKFHVTDSEDYKSTVKKDSKFDEAKHPNDCEFVENSRSRSERVEKHNDEIMERDTLKIRDLRNERSWMCSRMVVPTLCHTSSCYTSCHNNVSRKSCNLDQKPNFVIKTSASSETIETDRKRNFGRKLGRFPKLPPPKVIIHPPSSSESQASDSDSDSFYQSTKNSDIATLELSDCDTDDDAIKKQTQRPFLSNRRASSPSRRTPSAMSSFKLNTSSSSCLVTEENRMNLMKGLSAGIPQDEISPKRDPDIDLSNRNRVALPDMQADQPLQKPLSSGHDSDSGEGSKGQSSYAEKDDAVPKRNKQVRKSRKERDATSPRLLRRKDGVSDSPPTVLEDPSQAVHPIGACSDDPTKVCALCRMKTGKHASDDDEEDASCWEKGEHCEGSAEVKPPRSPSASHPDTPSRPHTPTTPRVKTPTSARPRTPLTVSVPKRSRDKTSSKSCGQPITPGILDKARGKGTTQHWVTSTDLQPQLTSEKEDQDLDEKTTGIEHELKCIEKTISAMPPNKNQVFDLNLTKPSESPPPAVTMSTSGGLQALAAVVSGVMRSAKMQLKKKTNSSKQEITEILSHSRPLLPTSGLDDPPSFAKLTEKQNDVTIESVDPKHDEDVLDVHECDDGNHSDSAKEDAPECDGESSNPRPHKCVECKIAFRIAGHLAKHLRSKGHIIAMQKKTLNRFKKQKLTNVAGQEVISGVQGNSLLHASASSIDQNHQLQPSRQEELLTQLGEGAQTLAQAQVRALLEGNDEYAEINVGEGWNEALQEASDEEGELTQVGTSDPRPFKCIACKVAFRFQGHLDRHFRSNTHLLAVGHFERDGAPSTHLNEGEPPLSTNTDPAFSAASSAQTLQAYSKDRNEIQPESSKVQSHVLNHNITQSQGCNVNGQSRSVDKTVKQETIYPDWSNSGSVKSNGPINGMVSRSLVDEPRSDLLNLSIEKQTADSQSNSKPVFESTALPEMPLPSTSPVQKMQELTC